jgi:hypothetical protein
MDAFACRKIGHPIKGEPHHLFQIRTLCATGVHECVVAMQGLAAPDRELYGSRRSRFFAVHNVFPERGDEFRPC